MLSDFLHSFNLFRFQPGKFLLTHLRFSDSFHCWVLIQSSPKATGRLPHQPGLCFSFTAFLFDSINSFHLPAENAHVAVCCSLSHCVSHDNHSDFEGPIWLFQDLVYLCVCCLFYLFTTDSFYFIFCVSYIFFIECLSLF